MTTYRNALNCFQREIARNVYSSRGILRAMRNMEQLRWIARNMRRYFPHRDSRIVSI